ncbi:hypothetical protein [Haloarchaeobius sp. TZWWS8]|uniref:hypothetical protein n=1 Tax=Haloarchaeobius sp. TZWWS8 TaxID=3446121 RepID=UPI003EB7603C
MNLLQRLSELLGGGEQTASKTPPADEERESDEEQYAGQAHETARAGAAPESEPVAATTADESRGRTQASSTTTESPPPERRPRERKAVFREQGKRFADRWPEYELDFSVESLTRCDELVGELAAAGQVDQELVLSVGSYVGETLLTVEDGRWERPDGGNWAVVLEGEETDVTLSVFQLAASGLGGTPQFAATYRSVERRV